MTKACNSASPKTKNMMAAILLSYVYLFLDYQATYVGAGDLAASSMKTGLYRDSSQYVSSHTLLTKMYNDMVNGSLPVSTIEIPAFFELPFQNIWKSNKDNNIVLYLRKASLSI